MDEQSIFLEALEKTDSAEVNAWLDASCGEDQRLRARVEALLKRHHEANDFLEQPVDALEVTCVAAAGADIASGHASVLRSIGRRFGEFKGVALQDGEEEIEDPVVQVSSPQIPRSDVDSRYQFLGEIARGGMGAVIKGRDTDLGRDLAVKVLLDDHKDKPEVVQRFVEEAQIGGQLQHPGIAPVYELGQFADQRPFFTMKLVKGKTLAALLSERDSPDQDQAKLLGIFEQVCQTMAYAHSRNVIHRDLKPANIMVGAFGEVQVMDWGLAKVLQTGGVADETRAASKPKDVSVIETIRSGGSNTFDDAPAVGSQTRAGSVMGTPAYMPPEQAMGEADTLNERADVFGLGAILCEILTGSPPYEADDGRELLRMAMRGDLTDCQSRLKNCEASAELIEIARKCVEADPSRRYRNAGVVAEHVTNHLESVARKLKQAEVRRKLTYVVAASLLLLVTGLGAGGVWLQARETELQAQETEAANQVAAAERKRAEEQEKNNEELQQALYASEIQLASGELAAGNIQNAIDMLESHIPVPGAVDRRGFEWHYLNRMCMRPKVVGHVDWREKSPRWQGYSADWKRIVQQSVVGQDDRESRRQIVVTDVETNKEVWSTEVTRPIAYDPRHAAQISSDGSVVCFYSWLPHESHMDRLPIDLWNIESGEHWPIELHDVHLPEFFFSGYFFLEAYLSPRGRYLAVEHRSGRQADTTQLVVWEVGNTKPLYSTELDVPLQNMKRLSFSPDESRISIVSTPQSGNPDEHLADHGKLLILDTVTGKQLGSTSLEPNYWASMATFSPDGNLIAATGHNRTESEFPTSSVLWVWDANTGRRIRTICPKIHVYVAPVVFSPDSRTVCIPQSGELFEVRSGALIGQLATDGRMRALWTFSFLRFAPNGRSVVAIGENGDLLQWDIPAPGFESAGFLNQGNVFESADGTHACRVEKRSEQPHTRLHVLSIDGTHHAVDIAEPVTNNSGLHAFSHDCRLVALSTARIDDNGTEIAGPLVDNARANEVTLWEVETGKQVGTLWSPSEHEQIVAVCSVPNRRLIAGVIQRQPADAAPSYQLQVWDLSTLTTRTSVDLAGINDIEFSHDGQTVAIEVAREDESNAQLMLYRIDDGTQLTQFPICRTVSPGVSVIYKWVHWRRRLIFSRDGSAIAALCPEENRIDIWDVKTGKKRQSLNGIGGTSTFTWSATGDRIIAFDSNLRGQGQLKVWDTKSGKRLLGHPDHGIVQHTLRLLPDGQRVVGWSRLGPPRIWDANPKDED